MIVDKEQFRLKLQLEAVWWLITAIITYCVVRPMLHNFVDYEFLYTNLVFVILFITITRYIFLLQHTFMAKLVWVKVFLTFLSIPLFFYLIELFNVFQDFMDNKGFESFEAYFIPEISPIEKSSLIKYLQIEMVFFGVASFIAVAAFPFRMLISVWRIHNKTGTV